MALAELFLEPDRIDTVFGKIVTKNDDSGRHGVLIPVPAYSLFPAIPDFDPESGLNYTVPIQTLWRTPSGSASRTSSYKHYHRYPERRITALGSRQLDNAAMGTLIIFGRRSGDSHSYEVVILDPEHPSYAPTIADIGLAGASPGFFALLRNWRSARDFSGNSAAVQELIDRFDLLSAEGFVPSLRPGGNRGVGNTFEIRMGGSENNRAQADVLGVELKSMMRRDFETGAFGDADLFLKEPIWVDGISKGAERVRAYGYVDDDGRVALYSGVKAKPNGHGLSLHVNRVESRLELLRLGAFVGYWSFDSLQTPLNDKLTETLYGLADAKMIASTEHYFYHTLIYCSQPSMEGFLELVAVGAVSLQIRMHVRDTGVLRNHGSQFRVSTNRWSGLFAVVRELRRRSRSA